MSRYTDLINWALLLSLLACIAACDGQSSYLAGPNIEIPSQYEYVITAYCPYLEEVVFPPQIFANEDFDALLQISAQAKPEILTEAYGHVNAGGALWGVPNAAWRINPWMALTRVPGRDSAENGVLTYRLPGLPAGDWTIGIQSTVSRELGGFQGKYSGMSGPFSYPEVELRYFPITVIERPEE